MQATQIRVTGAQRLIRREQPSEVGKIAEAGAEGAEYSGGLQAHKLFQFMSSSSPLESSVDVAAEVYNVGVKIKQAVGAPLNGNITMRNVPVREVERVKEIIAQRSRSVVKISTSKGSGTGYAVDIAPYLPTNMQVPPGKVILLTNRHVVSEQMKDGMSGEPKFVPQSKVNVGFFNGRKVSGEVVALSSKFDAAFVMVDATAMGESIPPIPIADRSELEQGQPVLIMGHPLGLDWSLTRGIVSHPERKLPDRDYTVVQTDAAINPGNSGGPMMNLKGEVIGTNSFKIVDVAVDNVGFAYHTGDQIKDLINNIINQRRSNAMLENPVVDLPTRRVA